MSDVGKRGVSPTVGVVLLIAIVVAIALVSGTVLLSLSEEPDPAPGAKISIEFNESGSQFELVHQGGDTFDGDRVEILGVADPDRLSGRNMSAGERQRIVPMNDTVELVWHDDHETSHSIWEGSVPDVGAELEPATSTLDTPDIGGDGTNVTITEGTDETITVDVENTGDEPESFEVSLDIGDDVNETTTTEELAGGQTETISFENVTDDLPPDDHDVSVTVDNDSVSGNLTVTEPPPAEPALSNLDIAEQGTNATITEGTDGTVTVDVENVGEESGSFEVSLDIGDGVSETATTAVLSVGESETVAFENVTGGLSTDDYGVSAATGNDSVSGDLTVEADLPEADRGCDWVDEQTNGGTDDITIDGVIVDCDVITDKVIEVMNGGGVIGKTKSNLKVLDGDDAMFWDNVITEDVLNLQNGTITGNAVSNTADVKLEEATVDGSVDAGKVAELTGDTVVEGDVESQKDAKVLGNSSVEGSVHSSESAKVDNSSVGGAVDAVKTVEVVSGSSVDGDAIGDTQVKVLSGNVSGSVVSVGSVTLQGATVSGDVYVDSGSFDCSDSTINGQDCDAYTPKDPDDY